LQQLKPFDARFVNGPCLASPPPGYEGYFGPPPNYRFFNHSGIEGSDDIARKVRNIEPGLSPEDTIRSIGGDSGNLTLAALESVTGKLLALIDEDEEIDVGFC
jgi:hypothetical protein